MAALSRFISRLGEKALPLYRLLRRTDNFEWTTAATAGLEEIKTLLAGNSILATPSVGEPMLLYISSTHQVVSIVLVIKRGEEGHKFPVQKPVRIGGPYTMQILIPSLPKDSLRGLYGIPKTLTLFSRVFNHGGIRSTT